MIISNKKLYLLPIILVLILVAAFFVYFFVKTQGEKVNYLIQGVPYYGVYTNYFDADDTFVTSLYDVLNYWGDTRFTISELRNKIPSDPHNNFFSRSEEFLKENGYEFYQWNSGKSGGELSEIKKFVNPIKKIPTLVFQRRTLNSDNPVVGVRLVIGVFDSQKKVITHDHDFGNNYEISYKDFLSMFAPQFRLILAIWPSDKLRPLLKPDNIGEYPARLAIMDKAGTLLMRGAYAVKLENAGLLNESSKQYRAFTEDPDFNIFPPAYRISFYSGYAHLLVLMDRTEEAIDIIKEKALPINNNLDEPSEGWTGQIEVFRVMPRSEKKFATPYIVLAEAYIKDKNIAKARENLEKALKIYSGSAEAKNLLNSLK